MLSLRRIFEGLLCQLKVSLNLNELSKRRKPVYAIRSSGRYRSLRRHEELIITPRYLEAASSWCWLTPDNHRSRDTGSINNYVSRFVKLFTAEYRGSIDRRCGGCPFSSADLFAIKILKDYSVTSHCLLTYPFSFDQVSRIYFESK